MFKSDPTEGRRETPKRAQTRRVLVEAALASFRDRGYDETTLRALAAETGMSPSAAYYHFPSKDHLVQELYVSVQTTHADLARARLVGRTDLAKRIGIAITAGLESLGPFHAHAAGFLAASMARDSPNNPLSDESRAAREIVLDLFTEVVDGSTTRVPSDIRPLLPGALFLGYLLVSLYWAYDSSPTQERTRRLLRHGVRLTALALPALRLPVVGPEIREVLALLGEATR